MQSSWLKCLQLEYTRQHQPNKFASHTHDNFDHKRHPSWNPLPQTNKQGLKGNLSQHLSWQEDLHSEDYKIPPSQIKTSEKTRATLTTPIISYSRISSQWAVQNTTIRTNPGKSHYQGDTTSKICKTPLRQVNPFLKLRLQDKEILYNVASPNPALRLVTAPEKDYGPFHHPTVTHPKTAEDLKMTRGERLPTAINSASERIVWFCLPAFRYLLLICARVKGGICNSKRLGQLLKIPGREICAWRWMWAVASLWTA